MSWWNWHSLPDDLATDLDLHRTSKYNQRQTFIQVNDVETKNLIALPADICWCFFSHSNCSSSSRNRWGSGVSKVQRQHDINCYWWVHRWMPTVFVFQDHVSRKEFFQRPPRPVHTETTLLTQQVHMNVNTCPTPPHPTPPPHPTHVCTHIPAHTETTLLTQQVHMNVNICPTPPHPNPPMCTKHHGLLKAVLQLLYVHITIIYI